MHAVVHAADVQDRDGGVLLMATLFGLYPFLLKLYAESGYTGPKFRQGLARICRQVRVEIVKRSDADRVAVVAAGVTVHESLKAAEQLAGEGVAVRVLDAYTVKPIDRDADKLRRKTIRDTEAEIATLTTDRNAIDRAMIDPANAEPRFSRMSMGDLSKRRAEVNAKLEASEAKWLEASEALESIAA